MNQRVLIMGGNGFIGRSLTDYLIEQNKTVGVYDLFSGEMENVSYHSGDLMQDESLEPILTHYDSIIYLISTVTPKRSMEVPSAAYEKDIPMLLKTLDACVKAGVKRVIFASSGGTVYGEGEGRRLTESAECNPVNHYAIAKLAMEKILLFYNERFGMENVILRIANPYGMNQKTSSGVGALTIFTRQILASKPITLYSDPDTIRDYISVKEVARAFGLALEYEIEKGVTPLFNVGSGKGYSLRELIHIIEETLGEKAEVNVIEARGYDVKCNILDTEKAERSLKFHVSEDPLSSMKNYIKECAKQKEE